MLEKIQDIKSNIEHINWLLDHNSSRIESLRLLLERRKLYVELEKINTNEM